MLRYGILLAIQIQMLQMYSVKILLRTCAHICTQEIFL